MYKKNLIKFIAVTCALMFCMTFMTDRDMVVKNEEIEEYGVSDKLTLSKKKKW